MTTVDSGSTVTEKRRRLWWGRLEARRVGTADRATARPAFASLLAVGVLLASLAICTAPALAAPGAIPSLVSPTHPSPTVWYSNANPSFSWSPASVAGSAVAGYSFVLDQHEKTDPDATSERVSLSYLPSVPYTVGSSPTEDRVVDLNGDGKLDIVLENSGSNTISVLLGNGDGTFQPKVDYATGTQPWSMDVGDVNGDGKPDVVTCDLAASSASVLINNGDGTFKPKVDYTTGAGSLPECLRLGDVNGDGKLDIVSANAGTNNVGVLINNGDGTFGAPATFSTDTHPTSIDMGDLNGDGKQDLVTANYNTNNVSVLFGNGNGTFQPAINYACGSQPETVAVADLNRDGKPDVVTVNYNPSCASVLLNKGDGTGALMSHVDYTTGAGPYSLDVADLNHDGAPDLVTTNHADNSISILYGNGDGTFVAKTDRPTGAGPFWVALGDLNGDGYGDLVVTEESANTASVWVGNAFLAASFTGKADGEWYFHVCALDSLGVAGPTATRMIRIDTTAPVTGADGLQVSPTTGWQTADQLVKLSATDAGGSGVGAIHYTLDGGDQQTYSGPFTVSGSASHTVTYWSVDTAGNSETPHTGYVNIGVSLRRTTATGLQLSPTTGWQNTSQLVTLSANDAGSGLAATYYTLNGGDTQTYSAPFTVSGQGSHEVTYWSVDALGNPETPHTGYVNIDTTAPVTGADGLQLSPTTGWQTADQLVKLSATDAGGSGVGAIHYTLDGGDQQTYSGPFTVSGSASHTVTYWSVDTAGNSETPHTGYVNIGVSLRRTTATGLQLSPTTGWQNTSQLVTLSANDAGSGLAATYYTLNGGDTQTYSAPFTVSGQGSHEVTYWSVDALGNPETPHTGYVNIDTVVPTVVADAPSAWSAVPVTVQLHAADAGGSGLAGTQYRLQGSADWLPAVGDAFTVAAPAGGANDGLHAYEFRALDTAGNVSVSGGCTVRIDTTAPVVTSDADAYWHNSAVTVHLTASDSGAGMTGGSAALLFRMVSDNGVAVARDWTPASGAAAAIAVVTPPDGQPHTYIYAYQATDAVGKQTTGQFTVRMDTRKPATTVSGLPATQWTNRPVALVFAASPGDGAPIARTEYSLNGGATWTPLAPTARGTLALTIASPGVTSLLYRSVNAAGTVEDPARAATVQIDTGTPVCRALKNVKVRSKKLAKLCFRIGDPGPSCGAATVKITIFRWKKVGKRVILKATKRIAINSVPVNKNLAYKFKVRLKKGRYTWTVTAVDAAGNAGKASKARTLRVK